MRSEGVRCARCGDMLYSPYIRPDAKDIGASVTAKIYEMRDGVQYVSFWDYELCVDCKDSINVVPTKVTP